MNTAEIAKYSSQIQPTFKNHDALSITIVDVHAVNPQAIMLRVAIARILASCQRARTLRRTVATLPGSHVLRLWHGMSHIEIL